MLSTLVSLGGDPDYKDLITDWVPVLRYETNQFKQLSSFGMKLGCSLAEAVSMLGHRPLRQGLIPSPVLKDMPFLILLHYLWRPLI